MKRETLSELFTEARNSNAGVVLKVALELTKIAVEVGAKSTLRGSQRFIEGASDTVYGIEKAVRDYKLGKEAQRIAAEIRRASIQEVSRRRLAREEQQVSEK